MSEGYTPITHELREYIERHPTMMHAVGLTDLCDNIDAIHKALEGKYADLRGFANRVREAAENHEDMTVFGGEYMALPLDADGEPIHVGDEMDTSSFGTVEVEGFVHSAIAFYNYEDQPARLCTSPAKLCHHHKPTVADLLRDMLHDWFYADTKEEEAEIIERFAKLLQLADGDAE